jgi:beta-glucosidase
MASYSEFEGVPIHVSRAVLTDMLRGRMGFTGTVVSDYNGIGWAQTRQLVAPSPEDVGALALAAAHADVEQYARSEYGAVSLADAVRKLLPDAEVRTVAGTGVLPAQPTDIPAALAAARDADVVILYIGGKGGWYGDDLTEKEGGDTADIDLPAQQVELVNAVLDVGKPTVAVVSFARPQGLSPVINRLPAVLTAYYGAPSGGRHRRRPLRGDEPRGQAAVDAAATRRPGADPPRTALGQRLPPQRRRHPQGLPRPALDAALRVRPRAELHDVRVRPAGARWRHEVRASLTVRNVGDRRGTEMVQLYAADTATGVTLPAQQLVGFARVDLEPGESSTVEFALPLSVLAYTGITGDVVVEPGPVELGVGSSSEDIRSSATFEITGETRAVSGEERAFLSTATVTAW